MSEDDAIDQDIFDSLKLSQEESTPSFTDNAIPLFSTAFHNASEEELDFLVQNSNNHRDASKTEHIRSILFNELVPERRDEKIFEVKDEELNLVGLMERCDIDMEFAIEVLNAFCTQVAESCSELLKFLHKGQLKEMYLPAVRGLNFVVFLQTNHRDIKLSSF
jgi:hypothetical protein